MSSRQMRKTTARCLRRPTLPRAPLGGFMLEAGLPGTLGQQPLPGVLQGGERPGGQSLCAPRPGMLRGALEEYQSQALLRRLWNAPLECSQSPIPQWVQQLSPHPPYRRQAPGSPEPVGSPPCPLTESQGKQAQLPGLTAPQHPPSPDPRLRWLTSEVAQLLSGYPSSFLYPHLLPQTPSTKTQNSSRSRSPLLPGSPPCLDEQVATVGEGFE